MYPEHLLVPFRQELTEAGFTELKTADAVDEHLKNLKGTHLNKSELKDAFDIYKTNFDELIVKYIRPKVHSKMLVFELNKILNDMDIKSDNLKWNDTMLKNLPVLIAHIFALWTFLNSKSYFTNETDYLFLPQFLGRGNNPYLGVPRCLKVQVRLE